MNILQFVRILWAHRWVTLATTVFTTIGAIVAMLIVPPRYEAVSRVMLNTLKPDPVTGEVISTTSARTYIATQTELIKDYQVAGKAVDQLNWASSPDVITQYQASNANGLDIRRWLSQRIISNTSVEVVPGTNILEISYRASSPVEARNMTNALRNAYIETTLESRRAEATRTANWYEVEAEKERRLLDAADAAKTAFEKEHGIVMQADDTDIDTARLRALASQASAPIVAPIGATSSASAVQLAQLEAAIAQAAKNLGPNHPQMIQMRAQRQTLQQVVAQEAAASRAAAGAAAAAAGVIQRQVEAQTSKVIQNREKVERLTQLQADVNMRRQQYEKSMARIAELRQEASIVDPGVTVLGEAVTPQKPSFPNKPLILGGAIGLGFALGVLLSLLLELLSRRVRSAEDLRAALDVPVLAVVRGSASERPRVRLWMFGRPRARRQPTKSPAMA